MNIGGNGDDKNFFNQSSIDGIIDGLEGDDNQGPSKTALQQKVQKLEQDIEALTNKNKYLSTEMQKSHALNKTDASVIDHIKGTLIQFLKNCPLTDKNNEQLLAIVFSMMEFSKNEIQEIQSSRGRTKI